MAWIFHSAREFSGFASEWDRLATVSGAPPFLRSHFIAPLIAEFAHGKEMLAIHAGGGDTTAMALIAPRGLGTWETYQPSQLPLGPWVMCPTEHFDELATSLLQCLPGLTLQLGLTQVDPRLVARPADSGRIRTLDYIRTAWLPVDGSFDSYWQSRGKNLRANMRKQRKKLEADGFSTRLEVLTRREDVSTVIESYGRLESAGWKAELGTAIDPHNPQGRFYRAMLMNFCDAGGGCMYRYWIGDKVVAVNLGIELDGTLVILKTTYDESAKTLSPASLLCEEMFKAIFDEGRIRNVEFFGKVMNWHTHWTKQSRMLYHVNCYRWGWIPRARALLARRTVSSSPQDRQDTPSNGLADEGSAPSSNRPDGTDQA